MAMVMLLLDAATEDLSLGPEVASRLSNLGVSFAALLSDDEGVALILDGQRFDPNRSVGAALTALGGPGAARTLRPLSQVLILGDGPGP
jgi:hypothetical protein